MLALLRNPKPTEIKQFVQGHTARNRLRNLLIPTAELFLIYYA